MQYRPVLYTEVSSQQTSVVSVVNSSYLLCQYIQQQIRADFTNIDAILESPEGQDEGVWKYEHLRQFCMELNGLAIKLQVQM